MKQRNGDTAVEFGKAISQIRQFQENGQTRLALDKLAALTHSITLQPEEVACVYEAYALCYDNMGDIRRAVQCLWQAVRSCRGQMLGEQQRLFSEYLLLLHHLPDVSEAEMKQKHWQYNDFYAAVRQFQHVKKDKKKLRIGYISPDFREHVVTYFSIQLLACYTRKRYEVFCYMTKNKEDETTQQLKSLVDGWKNLARLTPQAAAQVIYEDGIDILFDLAGHSGTGRTLSIAAYKPAPVQISGIGYFNTTGLAAMDYFLTDVYCDPPGQNDEMFREKLCRLPASHLCYTPSQMGIQCKLVYKPHEHVVFGSFNCFSKITDDILAAWLQIVRRVKGSHLVLKNTPNFHQQERLLAERAKKVGFTDRELEIRSGSRNYMPEYLDIDIALDTYPYPGGGTTCDALYMSVPVITLYSRRHGSRFGYSLLSNVGIGELASDNISDYIEKAVALASDRTLLLTLHENLRSMLERSSVMNGAAYTAAVEKVYEEIWQNWVKA
jgi:protein O-GlcNAc transferase